MHNNIYIIVYKIVLYYFFHVILRVDKYLDSFLN